MIEHIPPTIVLFLAAAAASALLAPPLIRLLNARGLQTFHWLKQDVDNRLFYELHQKKIGTPSMGGLLMLAVTVALSAIAYPDATTLVCIAAIVPFALLGLLDDVSKAMVKSGLRKDDFAAVPKFIAQWVAGAAVGALALWLLDVRGYSIPFLGVVQSPLLVVVVVAVVLVCTTNAVNITDGLDGLAGGLFVLAMASFTAIALIRARPEVAGFCAIAAGATIGYLFFNLHPAKVIMGDVGSMTLGASLAMAGLLTDALVPLVIVAGVFVVELISSFSQKMALRRGRRIFKIAPLHHHMEAIGWPETRITQTAWLFGVLLAAAGLLAAVL